MRRSLVLIAVAVVALGGCEKYTWERPGATDTVMAGDYQECRRQARTEAFRNYAFYSGFPVMGPGYWGYHHQPDYWYWRRRLDTERLFYENRLTHFCMRNKGYTLVKVEDDVQAVPPQVPPTGTPPANTGPVR
ncbi:MAG: hypothetical protein KIT36_05275 [Alphaproteobacteria bacterium]|nr:hypothetical protein [Alphaproteobacteria bacterium]